MKTKFNLRIISLVLSLVLLVLNNVQGQVSKTYSLDTLQSYARNRFPLTHQLLLQAQFGAEAERNVNTAWLPTSKIVGSAAYLSEVTALNLPASIPIQMEEGDKDQYKIGVELSQLIFDGGLSQAASNVEALNTKVETEKIEAERLKIEAQVNDLFEGILINIETRNILKYIENDLLTRETNLQQAVQSGVALKSVLLELEADITGLRQKQIENLAQKRMLLSKLTMLTQEPFDTASVFVYAQESQILQNQDFSNRPEYKQLTAQIGLSDWRIKQINRSNLPKLAAFGNGYYGRPGYNQMNFDFREYWMVGVGLSWNIGGTYTSTHQKQMVRIGKQMSETQRDIFNNSMKSQDEQFKIDFEKLSDLIAKDSVIVNMRGEVSRTAATQFESGAITLQDYVLKITAEGQAMVNQRIHEIQHNLLFIKYRTFLNRQ